MQTRLEHTVSAMARGTFSFLLAAAALSAISCAPLAAGPFSAGPLPSEPAEEPSESVAAITPTERSPRAAPAEGPMQPRNSDTKVIADGEAFYISSLVKCADWVVTALAIPFEADSLQTVAAGGGGSYNFFANYPDPDPSWCINMTAPGAIAAGIEGRVIYTNNGGRMWIMYFFKVKGQPYAGPINPASVKASLQTAAKGCVTNYGVDPSDLFSLPECTFEIGSGGNNSSAFAAVEAVNPYVADSLAVSNPAGMPLAVESVDLGVGARATLVGLPE